MLDKQTLSWLKAPHTWKDPLIHADGNKVGDVAQQQGTARFYLSFTRPTTTAKEQFWVLRH